MPAPFSLVSSVISYVLAKRACGRAWLLLVGGLGLWSQVAGGGQITPSTLSRGLSVRAYIGGVARRRCVVDAELLTGQKYRGRSG